MVVGNPKYASNRRERLRLAERPVQPQRPVTNDGACRPGSLRRCRPDGSRPLVRGALSSHARFLTRVSGPMVPLGCRSSWARSGVDTTVWLLCPMFILQHSLTSHRDATTNERRRMVRLCHRDRAWMRRMPQQSVARPGGTPFINAAHLWCQHHSNEKRVAQARSDELAQHVHQTTSHRRVAFLVFPPKPSLRRWKVVVVVLPPFHAAAFAFGRPQASRLPLRRRGSSARTSGRALRLARFTRVYRRKRGQTQMTLDAGDADHETPEMSRRRPAPAQRCGSRATGQRRRPRRHRDQR